MESITAITLRRRWPSVRGLQLWTRYERGRQGHPHPSVLHDDTTWKSAIARGTDFFTAIGTGYLSCYAYFYTFTVGGPWKRAEDEVKEVFEQDPDTAQRIRSVFERSGEDPGYLVRNDAS